VGAGIVADSNPEAEYDETLAKAAGFLAVIERIFNAKTQRRKSAKNSV
jgi:anthranilate/para-aminobenzoate synthase component I